MGGVIQLSEQGRALFTKEELAARVKVPAIVEQDLKRIISDRWNSAAFISGCFPGLRRLLPWPINLN